jgi:hypothetical protein
VSDIFPGQGQCPTAGPNATPELLHPVNVAAFKQVVPEEVRQTFAIAVHGIQMPHLSIVNQLFKNVYSKVFRQRIWAPLGARDRVKALYFCQARLNKNKIDYRITSQIANALVDLCAWY